MRWLTRPSAPAGKTPTGCRGVMWNRIAFMRRTSPVKGIACDGSNRSGCCRVRFASAAQMAQQVRQNGERGARRAVRRDQRGIPRRVAAVPVEDVDALDPRAEPDELCEGVVDRLRGVGQRLALVLDRRPVAALDDATGLGQPDLAPDGLQERLRRARLVLVR